MKQRISTKEKHRRLLSEALNNVKREIAAYLECGVGIDPPEETELVKFYRHVDDVYWTLNPDEIEL
jgi:hypothetical protein